MAIAKWIQFGATQTAATAEAAKPQHVQITPADGKQFGFENFGNICYANSVLQALYFCSPFRELLLQAPDVSLSLPQKPAPSVTLTHTPPTNTRRKPERRLTSDVLPTNAQSQGPPIPSSPATLFSALRSLFIHISKNPVDKGTVAPRAFIEKLKEVNSEFRNTNHQDAHEFLNFLLNKIVEEMEEERKSQPVATSSGEDLSNSVGTLISPTLITTNMSSNSGTSPQDATLVHKLFEGVLTSETRCLTCETVSSRDESFLDLSIDIEQNSSVTACLRQFSASEMLCQKNKFFCDACCDLQEAEKRMKIKKLPNVLALHLKRFKYQEDVGKYIKLAYRVAFPFELRLFNTVDDAQDPDRLYELFAIVVHIGNGPHHGHYVTIIRTPSTWLVFDDETVEPIQESEIAKYFGESNSGSAYVLYYQAVDLDLAALGLRSAIPAPVVEPEKVPAKRQTQEPSMPPIFSVPSLPPGLVDEVYSSDTSDSPLPINPTLPPSPVIPFLDRNPGKSLVTQPLSLEVPSLDENHSHPASATNSPIATPGSVAGLFQSLRHSPSVKVRGQLSGSGTGLEKRQSIRGRPSTSTGFPKFDDAVETTRTSLLHAEPEKHNPPERKASTWFKLKSSRRPGTATDSPVSALLGIDTVLPSGNGTAARFGSVASTPVDVSPSLQLEVRNPSPTRKSPKMSADLSLKPTPGTSELVAEAPVVGSATPSAGLNPDGPSRSVTSSTDDSIPPEAPQISMSHLIPSPPTLADHKRSQPQLLASGNADISTPISPVLPWVRPSTAGASAGGGSRSFEPEAPLPPLPTFAQTHRRRPSNDRSSDTTGSEGRPNSVSVHGDLDEPGGLEDFSASKDISSAYKRSTRKLSLSSPILAFGKKDKSKDKDKERAYAYEKVTERLAKEREKEAKTKAKEEKALEKARKKEESKKRAEEQAALAPSAIPTFALSSRI